MARMIFTHKSRRQTSVAAFSFFFFKTSADEPDWVLGVPASQTLLLSLTCASPELSRLVLRLPGPA